MYQVDTSKGYSLGGLEQIGNPDLLNWQEWLGFLADSPSFTQALSRQRP